MNDEFLYRLRAEPPPGFAARLRSRLQRQSLSGSGLTRARIIRTFVAVSLIGASAFAVMSPTVRDQARAFVQQLRAPDEPSRQAASSAAQGSLEADRDTTGTYGLPESPFTAERTARQRTSGDNRLQSAAAGNSAAGAPGAAPVAKSGARVNVPANRLLAIQIVGSPIAYPFTKAVADRFRGASASKNVLIEATADTSEGFAHFCGGQLRSEVVQAARRIEPREIEACLNNGFGTVYELKVGHYAFTLVSGLGAVPMQLTRRELYLALSRRVGDPMNPRRSTANWNRTWQDINSILPNLKIEVLGPQLALEAGDAFTELLLRSWCDADPSMRRLRQVDRSAHEEMCSEVRDDGAYLPIVEKDSVLLARLVANPHLLAIVDYRFLAANRDRLVEMPFEGVSATRETIANGTYPGSRPLYLYVKGRSLTWPLDAFLFSYIAADAIGPRGYLTGLGLIPLDDAERLQLQAQAFGVNVIKQ